MLIPSTGGEGRYAISDMNDAPPAGGWYDEPRGKARRIFGVAFDGQTWSNLGYLLLALPLGIAYFTVLGAVLTVGGGLFAIVVGVAILVLAMFAWPAVAEFERSLSNSMLGTRIDRLPFKNAVEEGLWPQIQARLTSISTWQSLVYLLVRLPIGIVTFTAGIVGFVLAPFTLTMSLHIINGAAFIVARLNEALLQPWDSSAAPARLAAAATAAGATSPGAGSPPFAAEAAPPATEAAMSESEPAGGPALTATATEEPFMGKAQRATAAFTDRVQAVTDELSERTRAAARGWNRPQEASTAAGGGPAAATQEPPVHAGPSAGFPPAAGEPADEPGGFEDPGAEARSRVNVDIVMRQVTVNGEEIELTPKEFDLLALFVQNPARPFSRDELLDRIWRNEYDITDRTIDTHIQRLRKKLGDAAAVIQTVWGVGYKYQPPRD